jgi:ferrous iron transport protein B
MKQIALIGSPNSGKSLLFNRLTGLNQKVANFPGITVDMASGHSQSHPDWRLIDFPGVYSLTALSGEEQAAIGGFTELLARGDLDLVVAIVDATRLDKGLGFALQALDLCQRHRVPMVIAANMVDVLERHKLSLDSDGLSSAIGVPVVALSARNGAGLEQLTQACQSQLADGSAPSVAVAELISGDSHGHWRAQQLAEQYGPKGDLLIVSQTRIDRVFLHSWLGGAAFFAIMYLMFQSIFTWAAPVMEAVENTIGWLAGQVTPLLPAGFAQDFVGDALFGGIGAFLVFVPQIFVLTVVVGILEDSGYLARAAVICHRPLRLFGLTGKSFIPMLSGVACAIPGIYAARTIESPLRRRLTYMAIPLMPCSARLPVYALLIAAFIPAQSALGGLVGWQGLAMFSIYLFGIVVALLVTALVSQRSSEQDDLPFVLEMPPYRLPSWRPLLRGAWQRSALFVTKAGQVIFIVTVVIWLLGYFPNSGSSLADSWLGQIGHFIEPLFAPLGLDWKYGVALITAFLAREVFVGTLAALYGIAAQGDEFVGLAERVANSGLSVGSGVALLVLFAIALQCVSTLAVLRRESGSWALPGKLFVGYGLLAYALAWLAYQLTNALGG